MPKMMIMMMIVDNHDNQNDDDDDEQKSNKGEEVGASRTLKNYQICYIFCILSFHWKWMKKIWKKIKK